jgi:anti-anti-sigma factor
MLECRFEETEKVLFCAFKCRMDTINSGEVTRIFDAKLREIKERSPEGLKIVFDLKDVDYIASAFIRLCLIAAKAVDRGNFSIVNTDPQVKKVFKLAGLEAMLNIS